MSKPKFELGTGILVSGGVIEQVTHIVLSELGYSYRTQSDEIHETDIKAVYVKAKKRTRTKKTAKIAGKLENVMV